MQGNLTEFATYSDAGQHLDEEDPRQGLTINTSIARTVLATCIQMIDQTIAHLLAQHGYSYAQASKYRLPAWWFHDDGNAGFTSRAAEPGDLWGGAQLPCHDS